MRRADGDEGDGSAGPATPGWESLAEEGPQAPARLPTGDGGSSRRMGPASFAQAPAAASWRTSAPCEGEGQGRAPRGDACAGAGRESFRRGERWGMAGGGPPPQTSPERPRRQRCDGRRPKAAQPEQGRSRPGAREEPPATKEPRAARAHGRGTPRVRVGQDKRNTQEAGRRPPHNKQNNPHTNGAGRRRAGANGWV